jgi:RNA polymerase sigma-70 factor, ECF subfamily
VTDEDLISRYCLEADRRAFDELDRRFRSRLWGFVKFHFRLHDPDADDVVEETLLKALLGAGKYDVTKGSFASWLFGIARRCALDFCASRKTPGTAKLEAGDGNQDLIETVPAAKHDIETVFFVRNALNQLQQEDAILIWLSEAEYMSVKEIASVMEAPETTVRHRLDRARTELRRLLTLSHDAPDLPPRPSEQNGGAPVIMNGKMAGLPCKRKRRIQPMNSRLHQLLPKWLVKEKKIS